MLVQCRGVDSTSVAAAKRVDPSTCWTSDPSERADASPTFLWPPYRIDRYADPAQRVAKVGVPATTPVDCQNVIGGAQHWIPFDAADGTVYAGGPNGCAGIAPEAGGGTDLTPSNTTYGFTQPDGTGTAKFIVNASESNGSMGCSNTTPCTLEIIPIMGISCDVAAAALPKLDQPPKSARTQAQKQCEDKGFYQPGEDAGGSKDVESFTVSGRLWWSASNWRNRIAVPLSLAPPANVCDILNSSKPVFMYGAEAMAQATVQWAPIVIVEGIGCTRRESVGALSYAVWVDAPDQVRIARGMAREGESHAELWERAMLEEQEFFAADGTRDRADLIVSGTSA